VNDITHYPVALGILSFAILWLAARFGTFLRARRQDPDQDWREGFGIVQAATLTLLGLVVGFTFSMATNRYDQRKNFEEGEANAIGTEYVRADLLPADAGARIRALLKPYLELRMSFYTVHDEAGLDHIAKQTAQLQAELWTTVRQAAMAQPNPISALAVAGMNDVLNAQGYTQASWWNRIPTSAWGLMILLAVCCNVLVGYGHKTTGRATALLFVLPLVIAVSLTLIADIDAPRHGIIRVAPQNLQSLHDSLPSQ
jgi:hypothetical protein